LAGRAGSDILKRAEKQGINFRILGAESIGISLDETTSAADVAELWS